MTDKTKPIFTLRIGAEIYLLGTKPWIIKACNFKTGKLKIERAQETCEVAFTHVKLKNGAKLHPFSKYKLEYGLNDDKYSVYFRYLSEIPECGVLLVGADQPRKLAGVELSSFNIFIPTNSPVAFDDAPPRVQFKIGDLVTVRTDHAKWYDEGAVEFNGKTGVLERINWQQMYDKSTFTVNFQGHTRTYSMHRFIDTNGNYLVFGWRYKVQVTKNSFEATPIQRSSDHKKMSLCG